MKERVFLGTRFLWLAWYPLRPKGFRCWVDRANGWHMSVAFGRLYLGFGPGVPLA